MQGLAVWPLWRADARAGAPWRVRAPEQSAVRQSEPASAVTRKGKMTNRRKRRHESGTPEKEDGTTEELKAFIEEKNGETLAEIKKVLDQRLVGIEDSLNIAYESITITSQKVTALENELKIMQENWRTIQCRVAQLEEEREEAEKVKRRPTLIFSRQDLTVPRAIKVLK